MAQDTGLTILLADDQGADLEKETLAYAAKLAAQPREAVAVYQDIFRALRRGDASKARELRAQARTSK